MTQPENPHRRQTFVQFLDSLLTEESYLPVVAGLRESPVDSFYEDERWHSVEIILAPFPAAVEALKGFAFQGWDPDFGNFSACNLKAMYILDEDFVDGGRAFVLFNLAASKWTHISHVANQAACWKRRAL